LYNKAKYNAVQNFNLLSREEILKHEPYVNDDVKLGLFLPSTKVTVPWEVCIASVENAIENGVKVRLNSKVTSIRKINSHFEVGINDTEFIQTKNIINACGLFADEIAGLLEKDVKYKINPRKGEYFTLEKSSERMFNHVIYSVPTNSTKGVLITPQVDGHTLIGPTSEDIDDKEDNSVTLRGLKYIIEQSKKLSRYIPFEQNIRNFAGVRAKSTYDDFYIKESLEYKGFYHVAGIDSPGLTAAPAIAEYLLSLIKKNQVLVEKESYNPYRKKNNSFHSLSVEQQTNLYKTNHKYGQIICKCEKVTKKEIIDAISGPLGVDTIKGIKKRTRAGAGICQGGFCEHDILKIIGMIKNKPLQTIDYYEKDTNILYKDLKVKK
ncbi:MAG: FAD-dependent oxidoreductase, partial [Tenericutes bacterium]|nr:FAD-dependent oxidoreductase [Mycoplasmatota bacterium]